MIRTKKIITEAGSVDVPIVVDEEVAGVQFDLEFDPAVAEYTSFAEAEGASALVNESSGGQSISVAVAKATALPAIIGTLTLTVTNATVLAITNALGANTSAEDVELTADHGGIYIMIDVNFTWTDGNDSGADVIDYKIYSSNQASPTAGVWTLVGTSLVESLQIEVTPFQGTLYYYVVARNADGEGPASGVVSLDTGELATPDVPEALTAFAKEVL